MERRRGGGYDGYCMVRKKWIEEGGRDKLMYMHIYFCIWVGGKKRGVKGWGRGLPGGKGARDDDSLTERTDLAGACCRSKRRNYSRF